MREEKIMRVEKVEADEKSIDFDKLKDAQIERESFESSSLEDKNEIRSLASRSRSASESSLLTGKKRLDQNNYATLGQKVNETTMPMINIQKLDSVLPSPAIPSKKSDIKPAFKRNSSVNLDRERSSAAVLSPISKTSNRIF